MSVSRDVISRALGVPENMISCHQCAYYDQSSVPLPYCNFWELSIEDPGAFCSFYTFDGFDYEEEDENE